MKRQTTLPPMGWALSRRQALAAGLVLPTGLWLPGGAQAVAGDDEPPPPLAPRPLTLPPVHEHLLPNGLTVVVAPRPGLPVLSLSLVVRAGPEADPVGKPGVANMLATLWPKGALRGGRPVPATELARQAEALGSAIDVRSSWGASLLGMTVTSPRVPEALALMADVLRRPLLAAAELERARAQALDGLRVTLGNPGDVAALALRRVFWGDVPHGRVAPPAAVKRITLADLQIFQALWVRPDRVVLVLAGDITPEAGQALAQRLLGDWKAPASAAPVVEAAPPQTGASPLVLIDLPGAGQTGVAVAAPFVATTATDRRIAQVAQAVLGVGYSSRINQEVRIQRGLSYGAFASAESFAAGGMFTAQAQTNHPTAAEVLQLLRATITGLADKPPTPPELAARQATLVGSFARRLDTNGGLSALLLGQILNGRPLADLGKLVPETMAVTAEQVQAFARQRWATGGLRAVVVGDLSAAGPSLAALAPQALRLTMAELDLELPGLRKPG